MHFISETITGSCGTRKTAALGSYVTTRHGSIVQHQTGVTLLSSNEVSHSSGSQMSSYSAGTSANVITLCEYMFKVVTTR